MPAADLERTRELDCMLHELKTPLTSIMLSVATLLGSDDALTRARGRRSLERILQCARAMQCFVGDMLDASALDAGRLTLNRRLLRLEPIIDEALEVMSPIANDRGITLSRELDVRPLWAWCDGSRVLQVLLNLISNALKFSSEGGSVVVTGSAIEGLARISVRDEGPGIDAELMKRLFQPYVRGHDPRGHGLGLYISLRIAEALNGSMSVDAEPGRGSTLHLTLPASEVS